MTDYLCPICGTTFNDDEHRLAEHLSNLGYMHLDIWVKCPKCKYTPAFGTELSDAQPIYWRPDQLPAWFKQGIVDAFAKHVPIGACPFCASAMELHKVWVHTWQTKQRWSADVDVVKSEAPDDVKDAFQFIVSSSDGKVIDKYFVPAGIMGQHKCVNQKCKYVRYVTL